jgi:RNA polymerase sigma factor (sigma-70 family)
MIEDTELLRRYAEEKSEQSFAELVQRRIGLVYSVALRQTRGDAHRARDATQIVFADLARKAASLARRPVLAGWLYRSAQFAATNLIRVEQRRTAREQELHAMEETLMPAHSAPEWEHLRPMLDQVLGELGECDRDAVLLRFFDGRPFGEIGAQLRLSENAARMRVQRALDKLHALLARRGVSSTTAALGTVLAGQASAAAPAGLAASVTTIAVAGSAGAGVAGGAWATFMSMTKLQFGIGSALLAAGATGLVVQMRDNAALRAEIAQLRRGNLALADLRAENARLARATAELVAYRADDAALAQLRDEV